MDYNKKVEYLGKLVILIDSKKIEEVECMRLVKMLLSEDIEFFNYAIVIIDNKYKSKYKYIAKWQNFVKVIKSSLILI